jgi:hypothetical protein
VFIYILKKDLEWNSSLIPTHFTWAQLYFNYSLLFLLCNLKQKVIMYWILPFLGECIKIVVLLKFQNIASMQYFLSALWHVIVHTCFNLPQVYCNSFLKTFTQYPTAELICVFLIEQTNHISRLFNLPLSSLFNFQKMLQHFVSCLSRQKPSPLIIVLNQKTIEKIEQPLNYKFATAM